MNEPNAKRIARQMASVSKVEAVEALYEQVEFVVEEKCYKMKTFHLSEWFD